MSGVVSPTTARRSRKCSAGDARIASYRTIVKSFRPENSSSQSFIARTMPRIPNLLSRKSSLNDFCLNASSALGSRRVICKYRETKQSRGSRTSRIIFAFRSSLLGTRYLPRKRSQRLPFVLCSKRSCENITRGNPGSSYRPGCSVNSRP